MGAKTRDGAYRHAVLAIVLLACMLSLPFAASDAAIAGPSGNTQLSTPQDILDLSQQIADGERMDWIVYTVVNDIDMGSTPMDPIGKGFRFDGTFDGNGKTITANIQSSDSSIALGLFSNISPMGAVINLNVKLNLGTVDTLSANGHSNVGFIAAENDGEIRNCNVLAGSVAVNSAASLDIGGVAGISAGKVIGCTSLASITATGNANVGGIVGFNTDEVTDSVSSATITINNGAQSYPSHVGGIVGTNNGTLTNCKAEGSITAASKLDFSVGGIAGKNTSKVSGCISNCVIGAVSDTTLNAGGIVGTNEGRISQCLSEAIISPTRQSGQSFEGGIAGFNSNIIVDCNGNGTVASDGASSHTGGIAGRNGTDGVTASGIINCGSTATISGKGSTSSDTGGLVGTMATGTLVNSYCIGNVSDISTTGTVYVGGMIGQIYLLDGNQCTFLNCVSHGDATALAGTAIGGAIGFWLQSGGNLTSTNAFWSSTLATSAAVPNFRKIDSLNGGDGLIGADSLRDTLNMSVESDTDYSDPDKMYRPWKLGQDGSIPVLHDTLVRLYVDSGISYVGGVSVGDSAIENISGAAMPTGGFNVIIGETATSVAGEALNLSGSVAGVTGASGWSYKGPFITLFRNVSCTFDITYVDGTGNVSYGNASYGNARLGESPTFTIGCSREDKFFKNAKVNGTDNHAANPFTFRALKVANQITVTYGNNHWVTVDNENPEWGEISPGSTWVMENTGFRYSVFPGPDCYVKGVYVDGAKVDYFPLSGGSAVVDVNAPMNIRVAFGQFIMLNPVFNDNYGNVNPNRAGTTEGNTISFNVQPNVDYYVKSVTVGGTPVVVPETGGQFTVGPVVSPAPTINIEFGRWYNVTLTADGGGTVSSSTPRFKGGELVTITAAPDAENIFTGWSDGRTATVFDTTESNDIILTAHFRKPIITVTHNAGGTVSPGVTSVSKGQDITFTAVPDGRYVVRDVKVDGASVGALTSYTFPSVVADHTLSVDFAIRQHTISVTSGAGGCTDPVSDFRISEGSNRTVRIIPDAEYVIKDVTVDGVSVGPVASYTFRNVVSDHTLYAEFVLRQYTISVASGEGGKTDPASPFKVSSGGGRAVGIIPDAGYIIKNVTVDGASVGPVSSYSFTNVTGDHTLKAVFIREEAFKVSLTAEGGGTVSGAGPYLKGDTATVGAHPDDGFRFVSWSDGGAQVHAFKVTGDAALTAVFEKVPGEVCKLDVEAGPGGSFVCDGTVPKGGSARITILPDEGYRIASVSVDGKDMGAAAVLVLDGVVSDHSVKIEFSEFREAVTTMSEDGTITTKADYNDGAWHVKLDSVTKPDGVSDSKIRVSDEAKGVWVEFKDTAGESKIVVGGSLTERFERSFIILEAPSDGGYDATVNANAMDSAFEGLDKVRSFIGNSPGTEAVVMIDITSGGEGSMRSTVRVDGATMKGIGDRGCSFEIVCSIARAEFDSAAVKGFATGANAVFTTRIVDPNMLDETLSEVLGGRMTFNVSVLIGDTEQKMLLGSMILHMLVSPKSGQNPQDASVIMADAGGYNKEVRATYEDGSSEVSITTDRLAYYGVVLGGQDAHPKNSDTLVLVTVGVMALIIGAAALVSHRVRKTKAANREQCKATRSA